MARVTIIIPSFNHQEFIVERLDSIRLQEFKDWEAIIIDDASSDNSQEVIASYLIKYPEFSVKQFIRNKHNSGSGYKSWEKGIALTDSEFIWIAETDDFADSLFLKETVAALENYPESVLCFTGSNYIDTSGKLLYDTSKRFSRLELKPGETKVFRDEIMLLELPLEPLIINGSSVVFRRPESVIPSQVFYYSQLSDQFLWTYLIKDKSFICINKNLNNFRRHEASTTNLILNNQQEVLYQEYCHYHNYFDKSKFGAIRILEHYIRHFLFPKKSKVGYFYTEPISGLREISELEKLVIVLKAYVLNFKRKLVNG